MCCLALPLGTYQVKPFSSRTAANNRNHMWEMNPRKRRPEENSFWPRSIPALFKMSAVLVNVDATYTRRLWLASDARAEAACVHRSQVSNPGRSMNTRHRSVGTQTPRANHDLCCDAARGSDLRHGRGGRAVAVARRVLAYETLPAAALALATGSLANPEAWPWRTQAPTRLPHGATSLALVRPGQAVTARDYGDPHSPLSRRRAPCVATVPASRPHRTGTRAPPRHPHATRTEPLAALARARPPRPGCYVRAITARALVRSSSTCDTHPARVRARARLVFRREWAGGAPDAVRRPWARRPQWRHTIAVRRRASLRAGLPWLKPVPIRPRLDPSAAASHSDSVRNFRPHAFQKAAAARACPYAQRARSHARTRNGSWRPATHERR
ncbi:hypothetical protein GGX14DRAFT_678742 [Mycena pura]|uniref:Uncharacterized protein n=1 Tax=Mycena pura TaxID=153505 RepID=A0AAD6UUE5_9AGAR|nr:hypothetical protein GGX14DRAFT_678742 [Mycena pura]